MILILSAVVVRERLNRRAGPRSLAAGPHERRGAPPAGHSLSSRYTNPRERSHHNDGRMKMSEGVAKQISG